MIEQLRKSVSEQPAILRAERLVVEAIAVLDEANAPADIAAHLDLAVHRMKAVAGGTAQPIAEVKAAS